MTGMDADTHANVSILTARIKEITELIIDHSWKRTPEHIHRLQIERDELMKKRRELQKGTK